MNENDIDNILNLDLYEILDISENSSKEKIKKSYKSLILRVHPDKTNGDSSQFELVNIAYTVLKKENLRKIYNKKRKEYLANKNFNDLKSNCNDKISLGFSKQDAKGNFKKLEIELNKKHNFNPNDINNNNIDLNKKLQNLQIDRSKLDNDFILNNKKINLSCNDFNNMFIDTSDKYSNDINEIVAVNNDQNSLVNYCPINDNNLYSENSISTNTYSTFNTAFNFSLPNNVENNYESHNIISQNDKMNKNNKFIFYKNQIRN